MRQKFCTVCGTALSEGIKFCESCGTPVDPEITVLSLQPSASIGQELIIPPIVPSPQQSNRAGNVPAKNIAGIFIVLIIAAAGVLIIVLKMSSNSSQIPSGLASSADTASTTPSVPKTTISAATAPTPTPDPFLNALPAKAGFLFGEGKIAAKTRYIVYG